ncbi:hypothetical protein Acsp06_42570 [Actinomycetospora sp. NBRC 106375]|uniref:hypothetical protein n=1 Tax=Actinomycetospora sp. NBRC 106375 TaxID=3032207 RepID=UPI0024A57781|nr:hypothetical protein [Actinomycetospora sp. NBRC 106375]GLZ48072.1 hypothetical protein Acsp06_42570 [Actinomycetospora sp. NBRC 106375]
MSELADFALGDTVVVPWGLDEVKGRVVSTTVRRDGVDVDVAVTFPDSDEPEIVTVPADRVTALEEPDRDRSPMIGGWLHAYHFEKNLAEALGRVLASIEWTPEISANVQLGRREADFVTQLPDGRTMFVEAKLASRFRRGMAERAVEQVRTLISEWGRAAAGGPAVGLVVFNELLPVEQATRAVGAGESIAVTFWRGPDDDPNLAGAVRQVAQ